MNDTAIRVTDIDPINHSEAMQLAGEEWESMIELLRSLDELDWSRSTDCDQWTVRDMAGHLLGAAQANASMPVNLSQMRNAAKWAKANRRPLVDGLSAVQIDANRELTPTEIVAALTETAPRAVRGRSRTPAPMRKLVKMNVEVPGITEKWTLGYLIDVIYTRDVWMHRVDISRATSTEMALNASHDGRIIEDVVAEWARRHGEPFTLELTGPAGNQFCMPPETTAPIRIDAIEFARAVSGRTPATGLLAQAVAF